jgi:hypothetical protein
MFKVVKVTVELKFYNVYKIYIILVMSWVQSEGSSLTVRGSTAAARAKPACRPAQQSRPSPHLLPRPSLEPASRSGRNTASRPARPHRAGFKQIASSVGRFFCQVLSRMTSCCSTGVDFKSEPFAGHPSPSDPPLPFGP